MNALPLLTKIPATTDESQILSWAEEHATVLLGATFDDKALRSFDSLEGSAFEQFSKDDQNRFINAALLADWACYSAPEDRADLPRLANVIRTFPRGFRLWFCALPSGGILPVGYTGWYPLTQAVFDKVCDRPEDIRSRGELLPARPSAPGAPIWAFNYSILGPLRSGAPSKRMLETYSMDLYKANPSGIVACVLSKESQKVAGRWGLKKVGVMSHLGAAEDVWATRAPILEPYPKD